MENRRKKTGIITIAIAVATTVIIGLTLHFSLSEKSINNFVQKSVLAMDHDMQRIIDKGLNHEELAKTNTGLTIFMNDTLVFWNRNDVSPRLMKRKINIGNDTICHLLSGDYYVKSYERGKMQYLVFRTINTTYQIENQYFESRCQLLPPFVIAKMDFQSKNGGASIVNKQGKVLTQCQLKEKAKIRSPYNYWYVPPTIIGIVGIIFFFNNPSKRKAKARPFRIEIGIGIIVLISLLGTYIFNKLETKHENQNMKKTAEQLLKKRDEGFENAYNGFTERIKADTNFRQLLFAESNVLADVALGYSKELLFDEKMKEYNTSLTICAPNEEITIQPDNYVANCDSYFLEILNNNKQKSIGNGLYFIDYYTLDPNYLGRINILSEDSLQQKTLYFEFYKPIAPEGFGFPNLLQKPNKQKLYNYSAANFRDNILVYKYGRYIYPNFMNSMNLADQDFSYEPLYKHYTIKNGNSDALVISAPKKSFAQKTTPFAVIFLGLTIPYLIVVWTIRPKNKKKRNLRQRFQFIILSTLGISFLVIGPVSVIYMKSVYNQKTIDMQFETTRTVAEELSSDIDFANTIRTASRDRWTEILRHYATNFFTELNLYNLNGRLIATTRPEIYDLNLQAPIMNAEAYQNMYRNKAIYYKHEETLGKGVYQSAYLPMTDEHGNTLAYLNTPYFSSTTDLHNEIKNFVLTYINIILVFLAVALIVVLTMTRKITKPLSLIQNQMKGVKFDQKNEHIKWSGDDEIGGLVKQYNQLIDELEKSAAELRRTTTESAWRGVARQVAHEIKNSLTPMRLSVQLLQRNLQNGKATPEQIQRTSNTLIEQINALSDMASSFSTFAKLPENHPAPLDLAELVGNVVHLYDNVENITFNYDYEASANHTYNGDKTNLNSAVGNLVKNAVQAIGNKPNGKIDVTLKSSENAFVISVKDNGKGIKEEDKNKIFLPNFTTKTGGSGVGLSLTYNIVQAAGGTISFESTEGEGAKFIIELPKTN